MYILIQIVDWAFFVLFAANVLYLLVYSVASRKKFRCVSAPATVRKLRFAVLIPAYGEDEVIEECVRACMKQQYPASSYDTVVISDHMQAETNNRLSALPIRLIEVHFRQSTKVKALNAAMQVLETGYDVALVLDADNLIPPTYLDELNRVFANSAVEVVQTHRVAKNLNNDMALLDAVSEEINNSIFRLGHVNVGMSAALIGSGMAFRYPLFRSVMAKMKAVGGFDRELELRLLYAGKRFHYMQETYVYDEKIQSRSDFSRQRRRWISAQLHYAGMFTKYLPKAVFHRRWDFCDKLFQQYIVPRLLLLGFTFLGAVVFSVIYADWNIRWWTLWGILVLALLLAIPASYCNRRLLSALLSIPHVFWAMFLNIFCLRGANKQFIHTRHGVGGS